MTYREARERTGMTLTDSAKALGVSKAAVSIWETGKGNPLLGNLRKMAVLYGVTIAELEEETDKKEAGASCQP